MKDINSEQDRIIEEMSALNWLDKYEYLIKAGMHLSPMPEYLKTEENIIKGCQSKVWLSAGQRNNRVYFVADSDTAIIKGIIALILRVLSDSDPVDIKNADLYFIDKVGLSSNLSPSRVNGLQSIIRQIKAYGEI